MARTKKSEEKSENSAVLQVSIEDFVRTRDSLEAAMKSVCLLTIPCQNVGDLTYKLARNIVYGAANPKQSELTITPQVVTGLATLQSAVQDLSRAYIAHTNTVIGKGPGSSLELLNLANPLAGENILFSGRMNTPGPIAEVADSKKRKRAPHDKNAPKRPVTPYFLYMQTARSIIAGEMEEGVTAKQVADEGTRRWLHMAAEEKEKWSCKYGVNFARYKEKIKAYKEGRPIPEISDQEAKRLYAEHRKAEGLPGLPAYAYDDGHIEEQIVTETSDTTSDEDESPEPLKAPSPPKTNKRHRTVKKAPEKKLASVKQTPTQDIEHITTPVTARASKSPELDRKKKVSRKSHVKNSDELLEAKRESVVDAVISPKVMNQEGKQTVKKTKGRKRPSEAAGM